MAKQFSPFRHFTISHFYVARRGIEPLISRMKTWRPNRLDERANSFIGSAKVQYPFLSAKN